MAARDDRMARRGRVTKVNIYLFGALTIGLVLLLLLSLTHSPAHRHGLGINLHSSQAAGSPRDQQLAKILHQSQRQDAESLQWTSVPVDIADEPIERQIRERETLQGLINDADASPAPPSSEEAADPDSQGVERPRHSAQPGISKDLVSSEVQQDYDGSLGPRFGRLQAAREYDDLVLCTLMPTLNSTAHLELLRALVGVRSSPLVPP